MKIAQRFLIALALWAAGILIVMLPMALLDDYSQATNYFIRLIGRALGLAAFPAGIAVASAVFHRPRPWPELGAFLVAAGSVSIIVLLSTTVLAPLIGDGTRNVPQLLHDMSPAGGSWETRNDAAWVLFTSVLSAVNAFLFAVIGLELGAWAPRALLAPIRRPVYWAVGLGLLVSGYAVWDTTYETIVLHTAADVSFAAFYTMLIPASICLGLALPTFALFQRSERASITS